MNPLRIGIDGRELLGARTGVGRYLGELLSRWTVRSDSGSRTVIVYTPQPLELTWPGVATRVVEGDRGTWWEQTTLRRAVRRDRPDVFFAPAYTAPVRLRCPLAVAIHDVSFSRHPEWFRFREGTRRRLLTRAAARTARVVVTGSEFSRREIHDVYRVPLERITVIPYGVPLTRAAPERPREPVVLFAGSVFNRRRVPDLIAAFALALPRVPSARLVIAGANRTWPWEDLAAVASRHGVADRVALRDFVSDEELASLYARARVFAFLSEYEGFGLTPLEAVAAGVPIVVLDTEVSREIYRDAAVFVRAGDIEATAHALIRLMTSPEASATLMARAPAVLGRYSWDTAADRTLAAIESIARR